jgi:hypothetical protein
MPRATFLPAIFGFLGLAQLSAALFSAFWASRNFPRRCFRLFGPRASFRLGLFAFLGLAELSGSMFSAF